MLARVDLRPAVRPQDGRGDIEDDDQFRYGDQTLHHRFGVPTAINVGDYLIGLGYRLVSREAGSLGPDVAAEIVDRLADAHLKLSEGQGAELLWRDARDKRLKALDALKIYALKTAPAFEAAFYTGLRLAGPIDAYIEPIGQFERAVGDALWAELHPERVAHVPKELDMCTMQLPGALTNPQEVPRGSVRLPGPGIDPG